MQEITHQLVARYIKSAQPFAVSEAERRALRMAVQMNAPVVKFRRARKSRGVFISEMHFAADQQEAQIESWKTLIRKEIHTALCTRSARYRKYIKRLKDNVDLLIAAIAIYIAQKLGIAVAVVSALVAALLRLVSQMGITVFCKRFKSGLL